MDLEGDALANDVEDREEAESVLVIGEDVSVIVAPQDHVINGPGYVDSALFRHAASIPGDIHLSTPGTMRPPHAGKPSALGFGSGVVAGLVVITPAAGFVQPGAAILMGIAGGLVCYLGILMKAKLKYDDSLDAFGVHGIGGTTGAILTGVFATVGATGLLSGNVKQFTVQLIAIGAAAAYAVIVTLIISFVIDKTIGLRVEKEDEIMGLDQTQHSESAYN